MACNVVYDTYAGNNNLIEVTFNWDDGNSIFSEITISDNVIIERSITINQDNINEYMIQDDEVPYQILFNKGVVVLENNYKETKIVLLGNSDSKISNDSSYNVNVGFNYATILFYYYESDEYNLFTRAYIPFFPKLSTSDSLIMPIDKSNDKLAEFMNGNTREGYNWNGLDLSNTIYTNAKTKDESYKNQVTLITNGYIENIMDINSIVSKLTKENDTDIDISYDENTRTSNQTILTYTLDDVTYSCTTDITERIYEQHIFTDIIDGKTLFQNILNFDIEMSIGDE